MNPKDRPDESGKSKGIDAECQFKYVGSNSHGGNWVKQERKDKAGRGKVSLRK